MPSPNQPIVDSDILQEIKSALGAPLIKELDWGDDTDTFIKNSIVSRVLRQYFTYFPIKVDYSCPISGTFEIPYPDDPLIFGVFRHFFDFNESSSGSISSPFFLQNQILYRGNSKNNSPYRVNEAFSNVTTEESVIAFGQAFRFEDYPTERRVEGSSTVTGNLSIQWAKRSLHFSKIAFNFLDDAIKLSKAYLLQEAARLRSQVAINATKVEINTETMRSDAQAWEEEVMTRWKKRGFAVLVKS